MPKVMGVVNIHNDRYKGARIIQIGAIPSYIPESLAGEMLAKCMQAGASVELLAVSSVKVSGQLHLFLIVRGEGTYAGPLKIRIDDLTSSLMNSLKAADVLCRQADTFPEDITMLPCSPGEGSVGACFFPPESQPGRVGWYTPGRYSSPVLSGINVPAALAIAAASPGSMISICAKTTKLSQPEHKYVLKQTDLIKKLDQKPLSETAAAIYEDIGRMASAPAPILEISFCAFGDARFTEDIIARESASGIHSCRFPFQRRHHSFYLYRGDEVLTGISRTYGHEPAYKGKLIADAVRLTHLCRPDEAAHAFSFGSDGGVKGLKVNRFISSNEPLPEEMFDKDGILIARHYKTGQDIYISTRDLTRHGFFTGKPGSGKTVFALGLLYELNRHKNHYPFLAIEPAKKEYRSLLGPIPDLKIYTPGRQDISPMPLNIFLPPKGVRMEQYKQTVQTIFSIAVSMAHPLDIIYPQVISRCYAHYGWRPDSTRDSEGVRIFGIHEFIREFRKYTRENYVKDTEALNNIEQGGIVRLKALQESPVFDTNDSIDIEELLSHPTVIELDALTDNHQRAVVMGIILSQIHVYIQNRGITRKALANMVLVDEAHLLLDQNEILQEGSPAAGTAVLEMLQNMVLIMRDYGTSLIFGDQSAARLSKPILSNVNLKMMFRMDSIEDRNILMDVATMTEKMTEVMASSPPGKSFMKCDRLDAPVYVAVPNVEEDLKLDMKIPDERIRDHMKVVLSPPFYECAQCKQCEKQCDMKTRSDARFIASQLKDGKVVRELLSGYMSEQEAGFPKYLEETLPEDVAKLAEKFYVITDDMERLTGCSRVHLIRELLLDPQYCVNGDGSF